MTNPNRLYEVEHLCDWCGEPFWGGRDRECCHPNCYSRRWRARKALGADATLENTCRELLARKSAGSQAYSKLLPMLFRIAAAELRKRGWDPFELLFTVPEEPATVDAHAGGAVEGTRPARRRWLHPPDEELVKLESLIRERLANGRPVDWHVGRREVVLRLLKDGNGDRAPGSEDLQSRTGGFRRE